MSRISFDLVTLAKELEQEGLHKSIRTAILRFEAAASAYRDLMEVSGSLEMLPTVDVEYEGEKRGIIGRGLLVHAVIVYARATHTTGKARWSVSVQKAYDQDQREKHRHIIALRDSTFAHYSGGEGPYGEGWYFEKTVLGLQPGDPQVIGHYRSGKSYNAEVYHVLMELVGLAIPFLKTKCDDIQGELFSQLAAQICENESFRVFLRRHVLSAEQLQQGSPPLGEVIFDPRDDLQWHNYVPGGPLT